MRSYFHLFLLFIPFVVSACASPYYKAHDVGPHTQIIARDASVGIGLVQHGPTGSRFCFQASPDAAFSQNASLSLDLSIVDLGNEGGSDSEGSVDTEMTGRTPALLFAREIFFRTCETAMSTNASPDEWRAMFKLSLEIAKDVMKAETRNTSVIISEELKNYNNANDGSNQANKDDQLSANTDSDD